MDDTKKLIEKYKRELMELSGKRSPEPAKPKENKVDNENKEERKEKTPQIIGYVGEESAGKYDRFLSELASPDNTPPAPSDEPPAPSDEPNAPSDEPNAPDNADDSDNSDDDILDPSAGIFGVPNFVTVPSTEQVNSDDTAQSVSDAENDVNSNEPSDADNASGVTDNNPTSPRADLADTGTTTNAQAEGLNRMPISGTSPDEQLTGRDFEDPNSAENSPENSPTDNPEAGGSRTEAINFPEIVYDNYEEFEKRNIGRGSLIFKIFAGQQSYPIKNAKITVSKKFRNEEFIIAELETNQSGATEPLSLPAPPKELSQGSQNTLRPFAQYNAVVVKNGYSQVDLFNIPIFDGIQSVQNVLMIPEPENEIIEDFTEVQDADR